MAPKTDWTGEAEAMVVQRERCELSDPLYIKIPFRLEHTNDSSHPNQAGAKKPYTGQVTANR